jgi:hypothetical protein
MPRSQGVKEDVFRYSLFDQHLKSAADAARSNGEMTRAY